MLTLPEELMLLALHDEKGSVVQAAAIGLPYGLAGAVLMELALQKKIILTGKLISVVSTSSTGDEILDTALDNIAMSAKQRKVAHWVSAHARLVKDLRHRLLERLVREGVLRKEEHRFLRVFHYDRYPAQDGAEEEDTRARLWAVLFDGAVPDERTALLLALVHACELAREVFPGENLRKTKRKLKEFAKGDQVANAIADEVVSATYAAISVCISAAVTTTIISSASH